MSPIAERLAPAAAAFAVAFVIDLIAGDPVYRAHPIRLIGASLRWFEQRLRALGCDGYGGGIALFVLLAALWLSLLAALITAAASAASWLAWVVHVA
ncbi:MAG TPA: cobalamin biosynthesis protein, partial [Vicinamibacterales bacterium]|nr:cobalamin biosynthesis protein [Vicinamibacterales bacterium]